VVRRRDRGDAGAPAESASEADQATAQDWLRAFERSEPFSELGPAARRCLDGAVRVMAGHFTRRYSSAADTGYPLSEMTREDVLDLLTEQLPHSVSAADPDVLVEALLAFLIWTARTGKIRSREVEYACRKIGPAAREAMASTRKWSPGKSMVTDAMQAGVDPADLDGVRAHAIARGLRPDYVDAFLPPGPVLLEDGRWLWVWW